MLIFACSGFFVEEYRDRDGDEEWEKATFFLHGFGNKWVLRRREVVGDYAIG